jgi:hypothetical protein
MPWRLESVPRDEMTGILETLELQIDYSIIIVSHEY